MTRPIERILPRLERVRKKQRGGWTARCPAHDDRHPSLGVRETSDGTVLVNCLAGCNASDIVRALGLELRDFFPDSRAMPTSAVNANRKPAPGTVREALKREYERLIADGEPRDTRTMNRARARIARIFNVELAPLRPRLHEGGLHGDDPAWIALFRWHANALIRRMGSTIDCDERERLGLPLPVRVRIAAEDRAARDLHRAARLARAA
jgi:hypothetical protein